MQIEAKVMMALIRYEFGKDLSQEIKNLITPEIFKPLYELSKKHDLTHLVADALIENNLLKDGSVAKERFSIERDMAIYRYEQLSFELYRICDTLKEQKFTFIPLKGSVIRKFYPKPWMRTSCDIDILVKPEDLNAIIEILKSKLEYSLDCIAPYDAILNAPSGVNLELRYNPSAISEKTATVINTLFDRVVKKGEYQLLLDNETLYFYHLEHMAKHFSNGGCGVRFFLDAYVINKAISFDGEKLQKLLSETGLTAFANAVEKVANHWFNDGESDKLIKDIEDFVLGSGIFGTMQNRVAIGRKNKSKIGYLFSRVFLPYKYLKYQFPVLQKHPILAPFCQVRRWFRLLSKSSRQKSLNELKEIQNGDFERQNKVNDLIKELKL